MKKSTSAHILDVALPLFAERPFDAVSTRQIAKQADVNLSAISYHFGSKEGLYTAIFERIINDLAPVREGFEQFIEGFIDHLADQPSYPYEFCKQIVELILGAVLTHKNSRWNMQLILREVQSHGPNFDLVVEGHVLKMQTMMCQCVGAIMAEKATSPVVVLTSQSIFNLCLQYSMNQELIRLQLDLSDRETSAVDLIKSVSISHICGLLKIPEIENPQNA